MITWRNNDNGQVITDKHNDLEKVMRKGGRKKQIGGMLRGPSHEQGGIAANVGNIPIEMEGGEYIINAQTVNAVGTQFLDELNRTQSPYHSQPGFNQGQLPSPSQYRHGGRVKNNNGRNKMRRNMRRGGRPVSRKMKYGGQTSGRRRFQGGGRPHMKTTSMRRGGRPRSRMMRHGGVSNIRRMQYGGGVRSSGRGGTIIRAEGQAWKCPTGSTTINANCVEITTQLQSRT